jgi:hypothetical protein
MRVDHEFIAKIDNWRRQQPDFPNRTESIRRLVDAALASAEAGAKPPRKKKGAV